MGTMWRELGVTVRSLMRRPGYALLATTTIVLGAGAATAGYGLLHEVVLRPLPYDRPERLVAIRTRYDADLLGLTRPEYLEVAERSDAFESVAALIEPHLDADHVWSDRDEPVVLPAVRVTRGFFRTLGVTPRTGALPDSDAPATARVVLSHAFWHSRFGGDPGVVGGTMAIDGEPHDIAAVLPASFEFPLGAEPVGVWILFDPQPLELRAGLPLSHRTVARLAPGVTLAEARSRATRIVEELRSGLPESPTRTVLHPLEKDLVGSARRPLLLLTLAGALVLAVAALNFSLLVGARNVERRQELRVRTALGADRGHLVRHLLSETGVLALGGGVLSVLLAGGVLSRVFRLNPAELARMGDAEVGPAVLLVGLAAAVVPALLAAVLPALRVATDVRALGSRGSSTDRSGRRWARVLSGVEAGMVFALLVVAVLVLRSLQRVTDVDPGFDVGSTVALEVHLPEERYAGGGPELAAFLTSAEERLEALPGVRAAGTITHLPLSAESWSGTLEIEGREPTATGEVVAVDWELVSPGYFEAAGIPLLRGRTFDEGDRPDARPVAIINREMARRWWPDGDPLGARISGGGPLRTVVGVVGDVKQQGLHTGTRGFMYLPALQAYPASRWEVVVRTAGTDPGAVVERARTTLLDLEPQLAVGAARPLESLVRDASGPFRLRAVLLGTFAATGLLLGMAGIYGITAHGVRSRRRDIGIRMAMGADGHRIMASVLSEALLPVLGGLVGGLALVLGTAPGLRGLLFGVDPTEPTVLVVLAGALLATAAGAVLPSAIRARRTDPADMLRKE